MNILITVPWEEFDPTGGVNVVVHTLGNYYASRGDRVAFLLAKWGSGVEITSYEGIPVYRVPMRSRRIRGHPWKSRLGFAIHFPLTCWRLAKILRRGKFQIVNVHYFADLWVYWVFLRWFLPFRLIVSVHGSDVLGEAGAYNLKLLKRWFRSIDKIVFCSGGFREQTISSDSPLYAKSVVILNSINPLPLSSANGHKNGSYVVCVAHLRKHKGQDVLLRALHLLSAEFPDLKVHFIGDGPFRTSLEHLALELGLSARVKFWGEIPREKSLELLRGASVMCLPSRREPFPTAVLEAMASKVPVVATNVGGIPEQIRSGVDGLLVPPDSPEGLATALRTVLSDSCTSHRLAASGYARFCELFTVERFGSEYRALLEQEAERSDRGL